MKRMMVAMMAGLILGLGCLMAGTPSYAAVPQVIPYQGQLKDAAGTPVNGVVNITFSLYTTDTSTTSIWSETHIGVNISKGLFKVDLGSVTGFLVGTFSTPVWLGVTIGTDPEMSPRTPLNSAPFALHADDADTVGGFSSLQLDQSAHVGATNNPHAVTAAQTGAEVAGAAAAVQSNLNTHAGNSSAHHVRYSNTEAVAAVGPHTPPTTTVNGLTGGAISSGVTVNGPVSATSVSATTLSGDGSGLTNVPGSVPVGANILWASVTPPPGYTYTGMQVTAVTSGGNTWAAKAAMPTARYGLAAAAMNGKIYAIGGNDGGLFNANEEYDPATDTWAAKAVMPTARYWLAAAAVNGKVYAIGGYGVGANVNEEYDPVTDTWATKAAMPTARYGLAAAAVGGKVYAIGGIGGGYNANEAYDPATDTWATKAAMPTARDYLAVAVVGGKIYAIGGTGGGGNVNEEYDPVTNIWATKAAMPAARRYLAAAAMNGKIYAIGGFTGTATVNANEEYDPVTNIWTTKAVMPTARVHLAAAAVGGKVYAIGGQTVAGGFNTNEEYDPGTSILYVHSKN